MKLKLTLSFSALAASLILSSCTAPGVVITPMTLPGCWEGDSFGFAAKVDITATDEANVYIVDGEAGGFGQNLPIKNQKVKLESDNRLSPVGTAAALPIKLKVEGSQIQVSSDKVPVGLTLKRCVGSSTAK